MSALSITSSIERARRKLERGSRGGRSDAGRSRLRPEVERELQALLSVYHRPRMSEIHREIQAFCRGRSLTPPSRSTLYNALERAPVPCYRTNELPHEVRRTLHNVGEGVVPGHQLVFAAFNYGDTRALSFASGLPWICLYRASKLGGWRPKSRGLLQAILACRTK